MDIPVLLIKEAEFLKLGNQQTYSMKKLQKLFPYIKADPNLS